MPNPLSVRIERTIAQILSLLMPFSSLIIKPSTVRVNCGGDPILLQQDKSFAYNNR